MVELVILVGIYVQYKLSFISKNDSFESLIWSRTSTLLSYVPGTTKIGDVDELLVCQETILQEIKFHLEKAQQRMKQNSGRKWRELLFEEI